MRTLAEEVAKFRQWASVTFPQCPAMFSSFPPAGGEWECDYPGWAEYYAAVDSFVMSAADRKLRIEELDLLLYTLARDLEGYSTAESLERFPKVAAQVIDAAFGYPDPAARWQAAYLLGYIQRSDVVLLLRRFLADDNQEVSEIASTTLQKIQTCAS
jgi:hypothetical protein